MIITLKGANFSSCNIGALNLYRVTLSKSSGVSGSLSVTSFEKGQLVTTSTVIANLAVISGYENLTVTVTMGGTSVNAWYSNGVVTIPSNTTISGDIKISASATAISGGGEVVDPEEPGTGGDVSGWTEIPLNTDASSWINATVSATGVGTEGSSTKRLTYNEVFDIPTSQRLKVVCDGNYQWGIRNGESATSFKINQYWLNSGDELQLAHTPTGGKFMLIFRKNTAYRDPFSQSKDPVEGMQSITKSDVATMQPKLYYKDEYSAEFDVTNYKHVMDLTTSQSDWIRATVSDNGPGLDNSSTTRLTYNKKLDASLLQEKDVILITCAADYQWGVRSSDDGTTFKNNSYWFNSGTCIRFSTSGTSPIALETATNFYIVFRKAKAHNGSMSANNDDIITFNDINTLNAKVYTAKPY